MTAVPLQMANSYTADRNRPDSTLQSAPSSAQHQDLLAQSSDKSTLQIAPSSAQNQDLVLENADGFSLYSPSSSAQHQDLVPQNGDDFTLEKASCLLEQGETVLSQCKPSGTSGATDIHLQQLFV